MLCPLVWAPSAVPPVRIVWSTARLRLCYVFFGWVLFGFVWFPWFGYGWAGGSKAPRVGDRPCWSSRSVTTPVYFLCLFGVDGQLAQVPRMGFYLGRCSRWVHGIVGRACGLSLVFLTPLPWCRLYLDCLFGGECVPWWLGVMIVLVFPCGGEVAWPCFVGR